ncbi:MAG: lipopolysaccharide biosynthesis protein [bacterium]
MESSKSISSLSIKNSFWNLFGYFIRKIVGTISFIILARILFKSDFGLISAVRVFLDAVLIVRDMGFSAFLIYQKNDTKNTANLIFFFNIFSAFLLYFILFFSAPLIANFYKEEIVSSIIRTLGLLLLIESFSLTHLTLLTKELQFKKKSIAEIISTSITFIISIILAFKHYGIWSLIYGNLVGSLVNSFIVYFLYSFKPVWKLDFKLLKDIFKYGSFVTGSNLINFFSFNMAYLIIGRFLGMEVLAIFTMAYNLANWTSEHFIYIISRVAFPVFSLIQDNKVALKKGYLKIIQYTFIFVFPAIIGLFFLSKEFVLTVYTAKWIEVIVVLKILLFWSLFHSIFILLDSILQSIGYPSVSFKINLMKIIFSIPIYIFIIPYGIIAFTIAITIIQFLFNFVLAFKTYKIIELQFIEIIKIIKTPFISGILMIGTIFISRFILSFIKMPQLINLIILTIANGFLYFLFFYKLDFNLLKELKKIGQNVFSFKKV